jgi:HPt (histidine-containing phosphotransfer) domain-containing protein
MATAVRDPCHRIAGSAAVYGLDALA